jgi:hypothetical protein
MPVSSVSEGLLTPLLGVLVMLGTMSVVGIKRASEEEEECTRVKSVVVDSPFNKTDSPARSGEAGCRPRLR